MEKMIIKSFLSSRLRVLVSFINNYQTNAKFTPKQQNYDSGYLSESQWFQRRNVMLKPKSDVFTSKLIEQPVTVKCGEAQYKKWNNFSEIENLDSRLLEILKISGQDEMTQIQKHTFDILNRQLFDLLGSAETGSGKTIAFLSPLLSSILKTYPQDMMADLKKNSGRLHFPLFLVLAPTRELVQQIALEAIKLLKLTSLKVVDVIGGVNINSQIHKISGGCHSIIATPGRLIDLVQKGVLSLKYCNKLVIDEADRMLDMGFEPQIRQIIHDFDMPKENQRHTSMFSATFPNSVIGLAETLMNSNYGQIMIGRNAGSNETCIPESIVQNFVSSTNGTLFSDGIKFLKETNKKSIVFCNKKSDVDAFYRFTKNQGLSVSSLHGDFSQRQRDNELYMFKNNIVKILIATAVAARGIDVSDIECVVNLGFPMTVDEYMHRVGRCGRMGREGQAMTFIVENEMGHSLVKDLIDMLTRTNITIPDMLLKAQKNRGTNYRSNFNSIGRGVRDNFRSYDRGSPFKFRSNNYDRRSNFREPPEDRVNSFNYRFQRGGQSSFNENNYKSENDRSNIKKIVE